MPLLPSFIRVCRRRLGKAVHRRCVSVALLVIYVAVAAGVPLPLEPRAQTSGTPFPCMAGRCGCLSAEHCWRSCCCHSLAERIAWARAHRVRPPEDALAVARQSGLDVSWFDDSSKDCVSETIDREDSGHRESQLVELASTKRCCLSNHRHRSAPTVTQGSVIGIRALACHGVVQNLVTATPTLVSARSEFCFSLPLFAWLGPHESFRPVSISLCPAVPPPELA
jgi:hypothetical protein